MEKFSSAMEDWSPRQHRCLNLACLCINSVILTLGIAIVVLSKAADELTSINFTPY